MELTLVNHPFLQFIIYTTYKCHLNDRVSSIHLFNKMINGYEIKKGGLYFCKNLLTDFGISMVSRFFQCCMSTSKGLLNIVWYGLETGKRSTKLCTSLRD